VSNFIPNDNQPFSLSDSNTTPGNLNPKIQPNPTNDKSQEIEFNISPELKLEKSSFSFFRYSTKVRLHFFWRSTPRPFRQTLIAIPGVTLVCAGFVMLIIPGPGLLAIIAGVSILALEFHWAKRVQRYLYNFQRKVIDRSKTITRDSAFLEKSEPNEVNNSSNTLDIPPKLDK